jgi:hypothetical protein
MKTSLLVLALSSALLGCVTRANNDGSQAEGRDQVEKAEYENKRTGFLLLKVENTGKIRVNCKGTGSITYDSIEEYGEKWRSGEICPSSPLQFTAHRQSCSFTSLGRVSSSAAGLLEDDREKLRKSALSDCKEFGASDCSMTNLETTCINAPKRDPNSSAGPLITMGICYSDAIVSRQVCNHTLTVQGMSPSTNVTPKGSIKPPSGKIKPESK